MNKALLLQKLKKHTPTILTCIGAVGVVATSVLTAKGTVKAAELLNKAESEKGEELTEMEAIKTIAPSYIPAVIAGVTTIGCMFGANVLNKRYQASLVSAYALLDTSYKRYKTKVTEVYGADAHETIKTEIAKDKFEEEGVSKEDPDDGKHLYYDMFSERYFECEPEQLLKAEYELNRIAATEGGMSANDFYEMIGLDPEPEFDLYGWSAAQVYDMSWHSWIEFRHKKTEVAEGLTCTFIEMSPDPFADFLDY